MERMHSLESVPRAPFGPEHITAAALQFRGETFSGGNHALVIRELERKYPSWRTMSNGPIDEGFITTMGRFVSREEAARIAEQAGQLEEGSRDTRWNPEELDSSELIR
jgi:hypothetical protein